MRCRQVSRKSQHAADYQALAGRAAGFHAQFVHHLTASAGAIGSAIGALPGQLLNLFNAAVGQILNGFGAFIASNPVLFGPLVAIVGVTLFLLWISLILSLDFLYLRGIRTF
jgi:hypothetical protein